MIPQERVQNEADKIMPFKSTTAKNAFYFGFVSGVRFAEAEMNKPTTSAEAKQRLFNYFAEEHDIQLMDSDFNEIYEYMKPERIAQ